MTSRILLACAALTALLMTGDVQARTTLVQMPADEVLSDPEFAPQIQGVTFYFGASAHPTIVKNFGEYRTNKKTNAFNKSDEEACRWVFRSAILQLHKKAVSLGANAVVNIRSNYKNNLTVSDTEYTCGAGGLMAGVALIGDFVTVE